MIPKGLASKVGEWWAFASNFSGFYGSTIGLSTLRCSWLVTWPPNFLFSLPGNHEHLGFIYLRLNSKAKFAFDGLSWCSWGENDSLFKEKLQEIAGLGNWRLFCFENGFFKQKQLYVFVVWKTRSWMPFDAVWRLQRVSASGSARDSTPPWSATQIFRDVLAKKKVVVSNEPW